MKRIIKILMDKKKDKDKLYHDWVLEVVANEVRFAGGIGNSAVEPVKSPTITHAKIQDGAVKEAHNATQD